MVDAILGLDNSDFAAFVADIGMCDAIGGHHSIDAPNTHAEGSKAINFIFCTPGIMDTVVQY
eukprot:45051-Ditylum_brightwellii.AAC.1